MSFIYKKAAKMYKKIITVDLCKTSLVLSTVCESRICNCSAKILRLSVADLATSSIFTFYQMHQINNRKLKDFSGIIANSTCAYGK